MPSSTASNGSITSATRPRSQPMWVIRSLTAAHPRLPGGVAAGNRLNAGDVGPGRVVGVQRPIQVPVGAIGAQVVGGGRDRIAGVVDASAVVTVEVAAEARPRVAGPTDPDAELHRPGRPRPGSSQTVPRAGGRGR